MMRKRPSQGRRAGRAAWLLLALGALAVCAWILFRTDGTRAGEPSDLQRTAARPADEGPDRPGLVVAPIRSELAEPDPADRTDGRVAVERDAPSPARSIEPPEAPARMGTLIVRVQADGEPIQRARVWLKDGDRWPPAQDVEPGGHVLTNRRGEAAFFAPGPRTVSVHIADPNGIWTTHHKVTTPFEGKRRVVTLEMAVAEAAATTRITVRSSPGGRPLEGAKVSMPSRTPELKASAEATTGPAGQVEIPVHADSWVSVTAPGHADAALLADGTGKLSTTTVVLNAHARLSGTIDASVAREEARAKVVLRDPDLISLPVAECRVEADGSWALNEVEIPSRRDSIGPLELELHFGPTSVTIVSGLTLSPGARHRFELPLRNTKPLDIVVTYPDGSEIPRGGTVEAIPRGGDLPVATSAIREGGKAHFPFLAQGNYTCRVQVESERHPLLDQAIPLVHDGLGEQTLQLAGVAPIVCLLQTANSAEGKPEWKFEGRAGEIDSFDSNLVGVTASLVNAAGVEDGYLNVRHRRLRFDYVPTGRTYTLRIHQRVRPSDLLGRTVLFGGSEVTATSREGELRHSSAVRAGDTDVVIDLR